AEDGIRDKLVTGVQTCALRSGHALAAAERQQPIELAGEHVGLHVVGIRAERRVLPRAVDRVWLLTPEAPESGEVRVAEAGGRERSEERRVGKGGRSRGSRGWY